MNNDTKLQNDLNIQSDFKTQIDLISRNWKLATAAFSVLLSIAASAVGVWTIFEKNYAPLPAKVAELEQKLSAIIIPSNEALQWVGTWKGKWDGKWDVEFQIFYTYGNHYLIEYSHQNLQDQPLQNEGISPGVLDGSSLIFRDGISIRRTSDTTAVAYGVFKSGAGRSATLTKN